MEKVKFIDIAVYKGILDQGHIALELKKSPQQYEMYAVNAEVMQVLSAAQFRVGKELVVQYRAGTGGLAIVEDIKHQGPGERLCIAAGIYQGLISPIHRLISISLSGLTTKYYLDKDIYHRFLAEHRQDEDIVVYYRQEGSINTIVAFE